MTLEPAVTNIFSLSLSVACILRSRAAELPGDPGEGGGGAGSHSGAAVLRLQTETTAGATAT